MPYFNSDPSLRLYQHSQDVRVIQVKADIDYTNTGLEGRDPGWYYDYKTEWGLPTSPLYGPFDSLKAARADFEVVKTRTYMITLSRAVRQTATVKISANNVQDAELQAQEILDSREADNLQWSWGNHLDSGDEPERVDFYSITTDEPDYVVEYEQEEEEPIQ